MQCDYVWRNSRLLSVVVMACFAFASGSSAQRSDAALGVLTEGSPDTSIGGQPSARAGDATDSGNVLVEGSSNVFINGKPAAVLGGKNDCGGITIGGAGNVFINGKPAARAGDLTSGCDRK